MTSPLRVFKSQGIGAFADWIRAGPQGTLPPDLLNDPDFTAECGSALVERQTFSDRYVFGRYLAGLLQEFDRPTIAYSRGLWSWLAAFYFDEICPRDSEGRRIVRREHAYILDMKQYFRHLVQMPWYLVSSHGETAKFLLMSRSQNDSAPLSRQSYILDQLASRQFVIASPTLVGAARLLFSDIRTGRPTRGAGSKGRGSPRRLAIVANQLSLTYDIRDMPVESFMKLLPAEFSAQ